MHETKSSPPDLSDEGIDNTFVLVSFGFFVLGFGFWLAVCALFHAWWSGTNGSWMKDPMNERDGD